MQLCQIFGSGVSSSFIISSNFSLAKTGCFLDDSKDMDVVFLTSGFGLISWLFGL
jgi:hypothetical protein